MPTISVCNGEGLRSCIKLEQQENRRILLGSSVKRGKANDVVPTRRYGSKKQNLPKNLDMCAETFGCETGDASDLKCSTTDVVGHRSSYDDCPELEEEITKRIRRSSMISPISEFPRLITTLGGENRLRLAKKREDGRLVLRMYKPSIIEAERTDGRLKLHFFPAGIASNNHHRGEEEAATAALISKEGND